MTNKKTAFISVGMHGREKEQITADIAEAIDVIQSMVGEDIRIIHNYECPAPTKDLRNSRLWYLGEAIKKIAESDYIYFTKSWRHHKGCIIEMILAKLYGIRILSQDGRSDTIYADIIEALLLQR